MPNLYAFVAKKYSPLVATAGFAVAAFVHGVCGLTAGLSRTRRSAREILLLATFSVTLLPHLLPFMHDRYFYPSDLLSIGLAFAWPAFWFVPAIFQLVSGLAYLPFLFGGHFAGLDLSPYLGFVGVRNWAQLLTLLLFCAATINWFLFGYLLIRVKADLCSSTWRGEGRLQAMIALSMDRALLQRAGSAS